MPRLTYGQGEAAATSLPWADGSVSLGLHRYGSPEGAVATVLRHARLAARNGFDGVTVPEHHAGFAGYFPTPTQVSEWVLSDTDIGWAGPCPILLPLRPVAIVREELSWMAARHPGRVTAALAAGYSASDFIAYGMDFAQRQDTFRTRLGQWCMGGLDPDPAVSTLLSSVPILLAGSGRSALQLAASSSMGLMFPPVPIETQAATTATFREYGGEGPRVLTRWVWLGDFPGGASEAHRYLHRALRGAVTSTQPAYAPEIRLSSSGEALAATLSSEMERAGASCLNVRFYYPEISGEIVDDQVVRFAHEVIPALRARLSDAGILGKEVLNTGVDRPPPHAFTQTGEAGSKGEPATP